MSEPIPESIPTSADPRSHRPLKRARGPGINNPNAKATSKQANEIETLFLDPASEIKLPPPSSDNKKLVAAPPEIVANVQGSSAGAGSGEFHVYKASRRREYERLRVMDEEAKKEEDDKEWTEKEQTQKEKDEEKTRKNREKRNKKKVKDGKSKGSEKLDGVNGSAKSVIKSGGRPSVPKFDDKTKEESVDAGADFGVAQVVKENGITIHDDD